MGGSPSPRTRSSSVQKPAWLDRAWARIVEEVAGRASGLRRRIAYRRGRQARQKNAKKQDKEQSPPPITVIALLAQLQGGPLAGVRLGLMHGRLSGDEKDAVMAAFRAGEIDVLVCTTVIEVGVDVPNATVMVVMDADRFGISQLHQLRGRIGRGEHPSLCLLATKLPENPKRATPQGGRGHAGRIRARRSRPARSAAKEMCWDCTSPADPSRCGSCRWPST